MTPLLTTRSITNAITTINNYIFLTTQGVFVLASTDANNEETKVETK